MHVRNPLEMNRFTYHHSLVLPRHGVNMILKYPEVSALSFSARRQWPARVVEGFSPFMRHEILSPCMRAVSRLVNELKV